MRLRKQLLHSQFLSRLLLCFHKDRCTSNALFYHRRAALLVGISVALKILFLKNRLLLLCDRKPLKRGAHVNHCSLYIEILKYNYTYKIKIKLRYLKSSENINEKGCWPYQQAMVIFLLNRQTYLPTSQSGCK